MDQPVPPNQTAQPGHNPAVNVTPVTSAAPQPEQQSYPLGLHPPRPAEWLWHFLRENWLLLLAIAYLIFPIDAIPDIVPIGGLGDDAFLIALELGRRWWTGRKARVTS